MLVGIICLLDSARLVEHYWGFKDRYYLSIYIYILYLYLYLYIYILYLYLYIF